MDSNEEVILRLEQFYTKELIPTLEKQMEKATLEVEAEAKKECPVDDGQLRASIESRVEANENSIEGYIGSNLFYAPYVHQGTGIYAAEGNGRKTPWIYTDENGNAIKTVGSKPNPFLQRAIDNKKNEVEELFKGVF